MSKFPYDENVTYTWIDGRDGLVAPGAPTVAALNAGANFTQWVPPDGFDPGFTDAQFSTSTILTAVDTEEQGRAGAKPKCKFYRDSVAADDDPYTTLVRRTDGFWVKRYSITVAADSAYVAAQKVDVFPLAWGERKENPSAANAPVMFESQGALWAPYHLNVAVVA